METTVKSARILYWCLCGLWCSVGAVAIGALLTYVTNWPIGVVAGTMTGVVLALGLSSNGAAHTGNDEELDVSERLRDSPVYSNVPGNRFYAE